MKLLIPLILLITLPAHGDFTVVAKDQAYSYTPAKIIFRIVDWATPVCSGRGNKAGCIVGLGTSRNYVYVQKNGYRVWAGSRWRWRSMDEIASHECEHHAYGPAHTYENYRRMTRDPQRLEKKQGYADCMEQWFEFIRRNER